MDEIFRVSRRFTCSGENTVSPNRSTIDFTAPALIPPYAVILQDAERLTQKSAVLFPAADKLRMYRRANLNRTSAADGRRVAFNFYNVIMHSRPQN